jgi:hypothetical protein
VDCTYVLRIPNSRLCSRLNREEFFIAGAPAYGFRHLFVRFSRHSTPLEYEVVLKLLSPVQETKKRISLKAGLSNFILTIHAISARVLGG